MKEFKVGDIVQVISEDKNRYVGKIDIIERIEDVSVSNTLGISKKYYLKNCDLKFETGNRLWFDIRELKFSKQFHWIKH